MLSRGSVQLVPVATLPRVQPVLEERHPQVAALAILVDQPDAAGVALRDLDQLSGELPEEALRCPAHARGGRAPAERLLSAPSPCTRRDASPLTRESARHEARPDRTRSPLPAAGEAPAWFRIPCVNYRPSHVRESMLFSSLCRMADRRIVQKSQIAVDANVAHPDRPNASGTVAGNEGVFFQQVLSRLSIS